MALWIPSYGLLAMIKCTPGQVALFESFLSLLAMINAKAKDHFSNRTVPTQGQCATDSCDPTEKEDVLLELSCLGKA